MSAVPAALNGKLLRGELDCSPISSFFYARHVGEFALLRGLCVASHRRAHSVCCVSSIRPQRLAGVPVFVTNESATGRALFDVLCRAFYGFAPNFVESADPFEQYRRHGAACVMIGDRAIDAALTAPAQHFYDLGMLWHASTGCDMVYALWAVRRPFLRDNYAQVIDLNDVLLRSLSWGTELNRNEVVERAQAAVSRPQGFYEKYFSDLCFSLDEKKQAGLRKFYKLAARCGMLEKAPSLTFFDELLERV